MSASVAKARARSDALLHASGQFVTELAGPLREADHRQLLGDDAVDVGLRQAAQFEPERHVLGDGSPRQERELLKHHGDPARAQEAQLAGRAIGDVDRALAVADEDVAAGHLVQPVDRPQDGRLA